MKTWILIACIVIAFAGILSQHGHANAISYASVAPLVLFGLVMLFKAFGGKSNTINSFALPLLLTIHLSFSGWWLVGGLVVLVWAWALTRRASGDYDFTPGFIMMGALIFTAALAIGVGATWLLK